MVRISRVFSARSVTSRSSSAVYFAGGMLSFSSRSDSTRRSRSRRSRYSARSFGSSGSGAASATEPSDSDAASLPSAPVADRVLAALAVAVVVEHRVLGGEQPFLLVGARHAGLREAERLEHGHALVLVLVGLGAT